MHDRAQAADQAWELLSELAARAPRAVRLAPGADDREIDGWGVPLPAEVRRLVRRVRSVWIGGSEDGAAYRLAPEGGLAPGGWATGPPGSAHLVHAAGHSTLFVDVNADADGASGAWGRVFASSAHFHQTWAYVGPSLVAWVTGLARAGLGALDDGPDHEALLERLTEAAHVVSYRPDLYGIPVAQARRGADPELAAVLAGLPDEALVVDLRQAVAPVTLHLPCPPGLRGGYLEFQRRTGGRFAIGFPRTARDPDQTSRSTTTGAWSEAPLPLRSSRST